jgi:hypothetical protein
MYFDRRETRQDPSAHHGAEVSANVSADEYG